MGRRFGSGAVGRGAARALALAGCLPWLVAGAQAATLYDNGPVTDPAAGGRCDSGPAAFACGGTGDWTFYDDFALASDAVVSGFDYTDWFDFGSPADYVETSWSLFDADPFTSAPVASGTAVATLTATGPSDQYRFEIAGLSLALSGGSIYWLGVNNVLGGAALTTVARVDDPGGVLDASKASDGPNDLDYPFGENRAFRIEGVVVPEPATAPLLALGLLALAAARRRRPSYTARM